MEDITALEITTPSSLDKSSKDSLSHSQTKLQFEEPLVRQEESRHKRESFALSSKSEAPFPKDLLEVLGTSDIQTLEDLVAKLEFENELHRVCGDQDVEEESLSPEGHSSDSLVEDRSSSNGDVSSSEEDHCMLEIVLQMEQEYDLSVYYNDFCPQ
ncbi:unnamed protein product [Coregonus sp. 'balchen']|uniref:Uncharacterized protein n=1 Tax=Coregonus suidteri TaxID=861788 RepID=A0AAN8LWS2_9TELE|nr:unnamed protein product [Coregonus sp. 'balchen']